MKLQTPVKPTKPTTTITTPVQETELRDSAKGQVHSPPIVPPLQLPIIKIQQQSQTNNPLIKSATAPRIHQPLSQPVSPRLEFLEKISKMSQNISQRNSESLKLGQARFAPIYKE